MEPTQIWAGVFEDVRRELPIPMVWLAMQAVRPLLIDGSFFVASLPKQDAYLAAHLQDNQAATAIEDGLRRTAGRILAFRLIEGETAADWEAEKAQEAVQARAAAAHASAAAAEPPPAFFRSESTPAPSELSSASSAVPPPASPAPSSPFAAAHAEAPREVSPTWEKLSERLNHGYKAAPFIKYPHGQAQYVLTAVKLISDTMDVVMPSAGVPRDDTQERLLAKMIERLSGVVNLDPIFLSLELLRYRELHGKNVDIPL